MNQIGREVLWLCLQNLASGLCSHPVCLCRSVELVGPDSPENQRDRDRFLSILCLRRHLLSKTSRRQAANAVVIQPKTFAWEFDGGAQPYSPSSRIVSYPPTVILLPLHLPRLDHSTMVPRGAVRVTPSPAFRRNTHVTHRPPKPNSNESDGSTK